MHGVKRFTVPFGFLIENRCIIEVLTGVTVQ